ncbi:DUF2096 family protein, partial [Candidatus Bathyarchaeota archaeon]|nr:DUF2096 family protein [Candidatus Bathyarchaeota archaeon]
MGYSAVWKVLDKMIADFRKRGIEVPAEIVSDLRHAKTFINILRADPSNSEANQRIEEYLRNVESYLISEAIEKLGKEYTDTWLKRIEEAEKVPFDYNEEYRFVPNLPRDKKWVRIKISNNKFFNT